MQINSTSTCSHALTSIAELVPGDLSTEVSSGDTGNLEIVAHLHLVGVVREAHDSERVSLSVLYGHLRANSCEVREKEVKLVKHYE